MEYEIATRTERVALLTVDLHEAHTLRRGLEHGLGDALDTLRQRLRLELLAVEERLKMEEPKVGTVQPRCGSTAPHRAHSIFVVDPWCTGVNDEGSGPAWEPS